MENSPPGIHTIPLGAAPGAGVVFTTVGWKPPFAPDEAGADELAVAELGAGAAEGVAAAFAPAPLPEVLP
ncbi:MAG TPA: hypothetical protein VMJ35_16515 [Dongiaceae bacterium]|nr:hypothetical protein [Dongiaceae bacterium]